MTYEQASLDRLQELLWGFAGHRVLTVAGRVGVLGSMSKESRTVEEVADELNLDHLATGKVIRALCAMGLVSVDGDRFGVHREYRRLFGGDEKDFVAFLDHSHMMYERWAESLEPWLKGERWETKKRDPEQTKKFGQAMKSMAGIVAERVSSVLDLSEVRRGLDVGGGIGAYAQTLCDKHPRLNMTVFDTPEVAAIGSEMLVGSPNEDRIEFVGGDYHKADCGTGYDFVLAANVLHQELPVEAAALVRCGVKALRPGGRLAVVDFSIDDRQRENPIGALFSINMRSFGDTYTEPTINQWMKDSGLKEIQRSDLGQYRWLIVGRKSL